MARDAYSNNDGKGVLTMLIKQPSLNILCNSIHTHTYSPFIFQNLHIFKVFGGHVYDVEESERKKG